MRGARRVGVAGLPRRNSPFRRDNLLLRTSSGARRRETADPPTCGQAPRISVRGGAESANKCASYVGFGPVRTVLSVRSSCLTLLLLAIGEDRRCSLGFGPVAPL